MPNDKISTAPATYGGKPGGDPFGDIDESASYQQVPGVYKSSSKNDPLSGKDIDEDHGGFTSTVNVAPNTDNVTIHQSVGEQPDCAGSLTRPAKDYSARKR